jgi:hypothetical protein
VSPKATRAVQDAARRIVRERDGHRCQMCGASIVDRPSSIHHRRRRGMGGSALLERASNLVRLCGTGTTGCHGFVESQRTLATVRGWLLGYLDDPEATPLRCFDGWHTLTDDGVRLPYVGEANG